MGSSNIHLCAMNMKKQQLSSDSTDLDKNGYSKGATEKLKSKVNKIKDFYASKPEKEEKKVFEEEIKSLLIAKADPNTKNRFTEMNLLHYLYLVEDEDKMSMLQLLISSKANVNAESDDDDCFRTPLHSALSWAHFNVQYTPAAAGILLANSASVTIKNAFGQTPLMRFGALRHLAGTQVRQNDSDKWQNKVGDHYQKIVSLFLSYGVGLDEVRLQWRENSDLLSQRSAYLKGLQEQVLLFVAVSSLVQMVMDYVMPDKAILKTAEQQAVMHDGI